MGDYLFAARVDEVAPGKTLQVSLAGEMICLANVNGEICAISDICSHEEQCLSEGWLEGDEITCPAHGARFNVRTGEALCFPAVAGVKTYAVEVRDGKIMVEIN